MVEAHGLMHRKSCVTKLQTIIEKLHLSPEPAALQYQKLHREVQPPCQLINRDQNHLLRYIIVLVNNFYLPKLIQYNPCDGFTSFPEDIQIMWYLYGALHVTENLLYFCSRIVWQDYINTDFGIFELPQGMVCG